MIIQTSLSTSKFLLIFITILLCVNTVSAQQVLKFSDHQSSDQMRTMFLKDVFFPAIEKESKGRLKIEAHWNGELASPFDALSAVSNDSVADMATVVPEYAAEKLPLHQIFKSFPVGPSGKKQVSFFRRVYAEVPEFSAELQKNNIVEVFLGTGYGDGFFSRQPLNTLKDLKGTKWRTASFWHRDFLANYGAIPVSIPWGKEVYKALEKKTLDGILVNVDSGYNLKVYNQAPYLLASENLWMGHLYLVAMNKQTWNNLEKKDQLAIRRAAKIAYKSLGNVMDNSFDTQIKDLKKAGAKVRILQPGELEQWKTATKYQQVQAAWVKKQEDKGIKDASAVMEKVRTILNETMR